jgi:hypothetical protein
MNAGRERGFDYLLNPGDLFRPRTQATALKAVEEGVLPVEAFIHRAVNTRPVFEEPFDLMDLERLLARKDLDLDTTMSLMRNFEKMIKDPDKEVALFAAESINAIEVRYAHKIQLLRKAIAKDPLPGLTVRLARDLYELAVLSFARPVLKQFYLGEAYAAFRHVMDMPDPSDEDIELLIRIILEQGRPDLAETVLEAHLVRQGNPPFLRYLLAQVLFIKRDYRKVAATLAGLDQPEVEPRIRLACRFWTGVADE